MELNCHDILVNRPLSSVCAKMEGKIKMKGELDIYMAFVNTTERTRR